MCVFIDQALLLINEVSDHKQMMLLTNVSISRELLDSMQAGTLEPEVAFLNASLVWLFYICLSNLFPTRMLICL